MEYIIVGLGNPGSEYERNRHSAGRFILSVIADKKKFSAWKADKAYKAAVAQGEFAGEQVRLVLPDGYMNTSGRSVAVLGGHPKKLERLIVVYDDLDLPIGSFKISFGRGHGGHNGLHSVIKSVKSKDFVRVRIGIAPVSPSGAMRKPKGEEKVLAFLMSDMSAGERTKITALVPRIVDALEMVIGEGREKAMSCFN